MSYLDGGEVFIGRDYQTTKSYSEKYAASIDDEVKLLIDKAYRQCEEILKTDSEKLNEVVAFLLEHETMSGRQFEACMEGREITDDDDMTVFDTVESEE